VKSLRYLEMKIIGKILSPGVSARRDILKKRRFLKKRLPIRNLTYVTYKVTLKTDD